MLIDLVEVKAAFGILVLERRLILVSVAVIFTVHPCLVILAMICLISEVAKVETLVLARRIVLLGQILGRVVAFVLIVLDLILTFLILESKAFRTLLVFVLHLIAISR